MLPTPTPTPQPGTGTGTSAVVLSHDRRVALDLVLRRLRALPVDDVVVVDCASSDGSPQMVRTEHPGVRLIEAPNLGAAGRNLGVQAAAHEHVLLLDDDAYPRAGAVEALRRTLAEPRAAVAGGFVRDVPEPEDGVLPDDPPLLRAHEPGTFDWWLRAGRQGQVPPEGVPAYFFPEGACMVRRSAFLEVGGFYAPYFLATSEIDLTTRLLAAGWDVRYQPAAVFDHMKVTAGRVPAAAVLHYRVRNQLWYFWRHFPAGRAQQRMLAYLVFDLLQALHDRSVRSWWRGVREAWTLREQVRPDRRPLPREVLRRAEMNRGRLHLELVLLQLSRVLRRQA